jgi:hypothetical protein
MVEADHAVAGFEFRDAAADLDYRAGQFVAQNLRRRDETVVNLFNVRATDPASGNAEKKLTFTNFRNRHGLDRDTAFAAINTGAHSSISRVLSFPVGGILGFNWTDG